MILSPTKMQEWEITLLDDNQEIRELVEHHQNKAITEALVIKLLLYYEFYMKNTSDIPVPACLSINVSFQRQVGK